MKAVCLLLCMALTLPAQPLLPGLLGTSTAAAGGGGGGSSNTNGIYGDMLVTFENGSSNDVLTVAILTNSTSSGSSGTWTLSGSIPMLKLFTNEYALSTQAIVLDVSYPDTNGTRGLAISNTIDSQYAIYTFPSNCANVSAGYWWKAESFDGSTVNLNPLDISGGGSQIAMSIHDGGSPGVACETDAGDGPYIPVTAGTWYWITLQYNQNAMSFLSLYTNGVLVGTSSNTIPNNPCNRIRFGRVDAHADHPSTRMFMDDLIVDWTGGRFPVGPASNTNYWSPTITAISTNTPEATNAIITWNTTNAWSSSDVYFSATTNVYTNLLSGSTGLTHSVVLTNLANATTYYFQPVSTASGISSTGTAGFFTTANAGTLWIDQSSINDNWTSTSANFSQRLTNSSGSDKTIVKVTCDLSVSGSTQYITNSLRTASNEGGNLVGSAVAVSVANGGPTTVTWEWTSNYPVFTNGTSLYLTWRFQNGSSEGSFEAYTVAGGTAYSNTVYAAYRGASIVSSGTSDCVFKVYTQ